MNKKNILISCIVSSLLCGNLYALESSNSTVIINDKNTTGVVLNHENLYITSSGSIVVSGENVEAVYSEDAKVITNSGNITVNSSKSYGYGIYASYSSDSIDTSSTGDVNITNSGNITLTLDVGTDGSGIYLYSSSQGDNNIINSGTISVENNASSVSTKDFNFLYGIYLTGYSNNQDIINSGTISVSGASKISTGIGVYSYNEELNSTQHVTIVNSGTLVVQGDDTETYGVAVFGGAHSLDKSAVDIDITNSGTISSTSANANSYGIYIENDSSYQGNISITNSGTISAISKNRVANAVFIKNDREDTSSVNITNSGAILAQTDTSLAFGINVYSNTEQNIINTGVISATSDEDGSSTGIFLAGGESFHASVVNTGTIKADKAISISPSKESSTILNSGLIDTSAISALSSTMTNSGTLYIHTNGDIPSAVTVDTFNQPVSGILKVGVDFAEINGEIFAENPEIFASNAVNIENGSTINVNLSTSSNAEAKEFLDDNGIISDLIQAKDINVSIDKLNITDNSPILDFVASINENDRDQTLNLKAVKATTLTPQDSPISTLSTSGTVFSVLGSASGIVQTRQNSMRGENSGDKAFKNRYIWFKPFGAYTKQNDKDGISGFDANTYGFGIGVDGQYSGGKRVGLAFFYSNTDLDVNDVSQSNDIDMFNIVAYGSNPVIDDKSTLYYQMGFGWQKNSSKRYIIQVSQTAMADYTSKSLYAQIKGVRNYNINDKLTIIPSVKGVFRYFKTPSYIESGAGLYDQEVQESSVTQVILGISTDLNYKINNTVKLTSNIALDYNLHNKAPSTNVSFEGASDMIFNTKGIKNSALGYGVGFGVSKELRKDISFSLKYSLKGRGSDYTNQSLTANFVWKF